ncbi:MAG: choice-of-anchor D domain-containing protein [Archangium sp.]
MNRIHLAVAFVVLSLTGCNCRPPSVGRATGEVQWEWVTLNNETLRESSAVIDFGTISMGARRDAKVKVRNIGRGSFTMKEFAQLSGSPVSGNNVAVPNQAFLLTFDENLALAPTEETIVSIAFIPPIVVEPFVDHMADLEFKPEGADVSTLSIKGRAIAGACALPEVIDFGALPVGKSTDYALELRNDGEIAARFQAGGVLEAPTDSYFFLGLTDGAANVPAGGNTTITVRFSPQEPREYNGIVSMRRADSCPEQVVQLKGRGVTSCVTWVPDPADAASGQILSFGAVPPGAVKEGKVTFKNECTVPVVMSRVRSNDNNVFALTSPGDGLLTLPAATRDATAGTWASGEAIAFVDFRPTALGLRQALMLADTDLTSQQAISVAMRGNGGGPKIDARPTPLNFGRVGFSMDATTPLIATRNVRITNVGTRPMPADPEANLHLGVNGYGTMYFTVRAITGDPAELCIGEFVNGVCDSSLAATYDQAVGIEAGTAGLALPIRFIPRSEGAKEYEISIFSNDITAPETRIQVLATAINAPPCNFDVSPVTVAFGLIDAPQSVERTFTLRNLGTAASEVCFFSSFELDPQSHSMFSLPMGPTDLELAAGSSANITVRAAPQTPATTAASVTGHVTFSVPTTSAGNSGSVELTATLSPACIRVTPAPLNFGPTQLTCGSATQNVVIANTCTQTVTFSGATITDAAIAPNGTGSCAVNGGCPQFNLISQSAAGVLNPGGSAVVGVRFTPYSVSAPSTEFTGKLQINVTQGATTAPYEVVLRGTGVPQMQATCVSASCPGPMTVQANTQVTLNTSVMTTGSPTCAWSVASRPTTANGTFSAPNNCSMTRYFADVVGTHVVSFNVSDGTGATAQCQTPITVLPSGDLWIEATWTPTNDTDLYLLHPNAGPPTSAGAWRNGGTWACGYANKTPTWGTAAASPSLDRDDTVARGPENIRINTPATGIAYNIGIHMFRLDSSPITSTVKVYCGGQLVTTQTRAQNQEDSMWVVGSVTFPGVGGQPCTFSANGTVINNVGISF